MKHREEIDRLEDTVVALRVAMIEDDARETWRQLASVSARVADLYAVLTPLDKPVVS